MRGLEVGRTLALTGSFHLREESVIDSGVQQLLFEVPSFVCDFSHFENPVPELEIQLQSMFLFRPTSLKAHIYNIMHEVCLEMHTFFNVIKHVLFSLFQSAFVIGTWDD